MGITSIGSNFVVLRYLVRYLPSEEAGIWVLFLTMSSYLVVFDLGISPTIGREISFAIGNSGACEDERRSRIRDLIATGSKTLKYLALVLAIVCGVAGYFYLGTIVNFHTSLGHQTMLSWVVFVLAIAASVSGEIWLSALYGAGYVVTERLLRSAGYVFWVILSVVVLRSGGGLIGLSLAWFYAFAIRLVARQLLLRSRRELRQRGSFNAELARSLAGKSLKYAGTAIGGTLILYTDNIVIASVLGTSYVPNYYAVARLVSACLAVALLISTASSPFISAAFADGKMEEVRRITMRNVRVALVLMAAGASFLAFFGKQLIQIWIGKDNFVGFGVLLVMLCAMTLEAHHVSLATATMACDKIPFFVPALLAGAVNVCLSFPLAHRYGLIGVALGTLLAQILTNNWFVPMYSLRHLRIRFSRYLLYVVLPLAAVFAVFAGGNFLLHRAVLVHSNFVQVVSGLILNCALLIAAALCGRSLGTEKRIPITDRASRRGTVSSG